MGYFDKVPGYMWPAERYTKPEPDAEGKFDLPWGQADDVSKDLICKLPPSGWSEEWLPKPKPEPTTTKPEPTTTLAATAMPDTEPDVSLSVTTTASWLVLLGLALTNVV